MPISRVILVASVAIGITIFLGLLVTKARSDHEEDQPPTPYFVDESYR